MEYLLHVAASVTVAENDTRVYTSTTFASLRVDVPHVEVDRCHVSLSIAEDPLVDDIDRNSIDDIMAMRICHRSSASLAKVLPVLHSA